jgi:hypothetical protein
MRPPIIGIIIFHRASYQITTKWRKMVQEPENKGRFVEGIPQGSYIGLKLEQRNANHSAKK